MGTCRFCNQSAGMLRKEHRECRHRYEDGRSAAIALITTSAGDLLSPSEIRTEFEKIAHRAGIVEPEVDQIISSGLSGAIDRCLDDHVLSISEESAILRIVEAFEFDLDQHRDIKERLVKGAILRDLREGLVADRVTFYGSLPFRLVKDEYLVWLFEGCGYFEMTRRSHYQAGSRGVSVRIAKGVYYRVGSARGQRITTENFEETDSGTFAITNKHILFNGSRKTFRIRLEKLISCELMANGILFYKDAANPKPQGISLSDPLFAANLLAAL